MHFTTIVSAVVLLAAGSAQAGQFQFFNSNDCTTGAGLLVGDGCHGTEGRHSFKVTGCKGRVEIHDESGCKGNPTRVYTALQDSCVHVQAQGPFKSAKVSCV